MRILFLLLFFVSVGVSAQLMKPKQNFTRQDSLRGTNNEFRNWWDVKHYEIILLPNYENQSISGVVKIEFELEENYQGQSIMQIDLQQPMQIKSVTYSNSSQRDFHKTYKTVNDSHIKREQNVYFIALDSVMNSLGLLDKSNPNNKSDLRHEVAINFSGNPRIAKNPPWDGGWVFAQDALGRPWMSVACQGLGASVWFPNKDYLGDEPDNGMKISIATPKSLTAVANGFSQKEKIKQEDMQAVAWKVENPINNYNIIPYIGHYGHFSDTFEGENGTLNLDYWVLDYNVEKAKKHFAQVKPMLHALEDWFGPYPFYEDGYKLVESPYLGMEHQSAIAYGNRFVNGYLGSDLSGTGWGKKFDFIIVHETGHEWFGNNITVKDIADMWVHEAFTSYSETLYLESLYGKKAGSEYVIGTRLNILNDRPIIGHYGVNKEGSGDMYFKGANMIHTLRQLIEDDVLFKEILRGLNQDFRHQTVTTQQIENYISEKAGKNFTQFFDQYLRTTQIPTLVWKKEDGKIQFRWENVVKGFDMPVRLAKSNEWIFPTEIWKTYQGKAHRILIDENFYVEVQRKD